MDLYLQEVEAATFLGDQAPEVRLKVHSVASTFPLILQKTSLWRQAKIPPNLWFWLCKSNDNKGRRAGVAGGVGNEEDFGQSKRGTWPNRPLCALRT